MNSFRAKPFQTFAITSAGSVLCSDISGSKRFDLLMVPTLFLTPIAVVESLQTFKLLLSSFI